ncbi:DnaJ domain-containing protein [Bradyrhizobium sp.]|uniref:DnaJ domain-containing protein n=1 Tax=Bradyrhizobium sp. TaxID=376 RepID=UPI003C43894D
METLYELLGALPNDDAEGLRAAFRRAVKGAHPDINPGDPLAALRFRQIVRASEILADTDQRAAYDHLLELARIEQVSLSRRAVTQAVYRFSSAVFAFAVVSIVGLAGYAVFMHVSSRSGVRLQQLEAVVRGQVEAALRGQLAHDQVSYDQVSREQVSRGEVMASAKAPEGMTTESIVAFAPVHAGEPQAAAAPTETAEAVKDKDPANEKPKLEIADAPDQAIAASVVTFPADTGAALAAIVGPVPPMPLSDAKSYRARGIFAYRNGDLNGAIADFDQAIQLDPKFAAAYIDRGIVFYRLRKFERAFADISQAKRLEKDNRGAKTLVPSVVRKPRPPGGIELGAMSVVQRRPVGLD